MNETLAPARRTAAPRPAAPAPTTTASKSSIPSLPGAKSSGIEIAVGLAIVREARDIPVLDQMSICLPHRRPAANENNAVWIAFNHLLRLLARTDDDQFSFRAPIPGRSRLSAARQ